MKDLAYRVSTSTVPSVKSLSDGLGLVSTLNVCPGMMFFFGRSASTTCLYDMTNYVAKRSIQFDKKIVVIINSKLHVCKLRRWTRHMWGP
jgi:hypothetical protein